MTEATACGKIILLGEHSVVYGHPALAIGIAHGARAEFTADHGPTVSLSVSPWNVEASRADGSDLGRALDALLKNLAAPAELCGKIKATVQLPSGGGLGSSAALGVAIARAVGAHLRGRALDTDETLAAALAWEKIFHGNPSGVDHTMATLGGAGIFTRADGLTPVAFPATLRLLLADSGERASTRSMVESVARIHARKPEATDRTFDAIASIVRNGALSLASGDMRALGQLMDMNQALLSSLLLSTERIEELCAAARAAGAHGAKVTGSGGGGCVIALATEGEGRVLEAWKALGAPTMLVECSSTNT